MTAMEFKSIQLPSRHGEISCSNGSAKVMTFQRSAKAFFWLLHARAAIFGTSGSLACLFGMKASFPLRDERRECAELVASVEVNLIEYPYEDAGKYYQSGAIDACLSASQAIRNK